MIQCNKYNKKVMMQCKNKNDLIKQYNYEVLYNIINAIFRLIQSY